MDALTEKDIVKIWQNQLLDKERLATEDGVPLQVIFPGRPNNDRGADFREAVIILGGRLMKGDIELHVRRSDWTAHGHHQDAAYNRVILHVVFRNDSPPPVRMQNGHAVPTVALDKYIDTPDHEALISVSSECQLDLACARVARQPPANISERLDKAGDERFLIKAERFRQDLSRTWESQALYQGVMGALGYSCNKIPFLELARRLPLRFLGSQTGDNLPDSDWLLRFQALLLGTAGLLPLLRRSECYHRALGREWLEEVEKLWAASPPIEEMSPDDWHLKPVRPNNSPIFRLLAMSYLLLRFREKGWLEGLVGLVRKAPPGKGSPRYLEAGMVVTVDNLPSSCPGPENLSRRLTLLGSQRAADIVVNVLLPFTYAWSQSTAQPEPGKKALELYSLYPRLTTNSVEERMARRLGIARKLVNSARRQQGLLHIHNNYCETGRCGECPLRHL